MRRRTIAALWYTPRMFGKREHRSERPAVWDYSNPTAQKRVRLRILLRAPRTRRPAKKK